MRKIVLFMALLMSWAGAEPHKNLGPQGEWVSNGRWLLKVEQFRIADDNSQFLALPWTKSIASKEGKAFANQVERLVFTKKGRIVWLDVSLKNVTGATQKIGHDLPSWHIRCLDGQEVRNTGAIARGALSHLIDPLPKTQKVAAGETLRGSMVFALPANTKPGLFFFKASPTMEKVAGKSETLVSRLGEAVKSNVKALTPSNPKAPWQENKLWKMRLIDQRLVSSAKAYQGLPWGPRLKGAQRTKHFSYVERNVYAKGGQVLLLTLEAKNLSESKKPLGYEIPFWQLVGTDGKKLRLAGAYQQQIPWALQGGLAKRTLLNSKAKTGGTVGFFLPKGFQPVELVAEVPKSLEKNYGPSGHFRFKL